MMPHHCMLLLLGIAASLPSSASSQFGVDHCAPNSPLPSATGCPSCESRCGLISGENDTLCSCDANCVVYGDCCEDYKDVCKTEAEQSKKIIRSDWNRATACVPYYQIPRTDRVFQSTMISTCPDGTRCETDENNIGKFVPIVDLNTNLLYKHAQCALCNNVQRAKLWNVNVSCAIANGTIKSMTAFNELLRNKTCSVDIIGPPIDHKVRQCYKTIANCSSLCQNKELSDRCMGGTQSYTSAVPISAHAYKNIYCALCSKESGAMGPPRCGEVSPLAMVSTAIRGDSSGVLFGATLDLIFDFNPDHGLQVGKTEKHCTPDEVWVPAERDCRKIACPSDNVMVKDQCVPLKFNKTITANIAFNNTQDADKIAKYLLTPGNQWNDGVSEKVNDVFKEVFQEDKSMIEVKMDLVSGASQINISETLIVSLSSNETLNETTLNKFYKDVRGIIETELLDLLQQHRIDENSFQIIFDNKDKVSLGKGCLHLYYKKSQFSLKGDRLIVKSTGKEYEPNDYKLLGSSAIVCVPFSYLSTAVAYPHDSKALEIIATICTVLSILCLSVRIGLQLFFPYFHSFAGKLQFHLCLALCMAFLFMLIGGALKGTSPTWPCAMFGILTYFAFLAVFAWVSAIAFNTWIVFRPSSSFIKADDKSQSLRFYLLVGWMLPALLALIVFGLDFSTTMDPKFKPTFAAPLCYFNQRYSLLVFFGLPVSISVVINLVLFVLIVYVLRKTFKEAATSTGNSSGQKKNFGIYVRLFVLMGISWTFGFVASFTGNTVVWIIFVILNSCQGILIFVSFVCRKPILKQIFKRWSDDTEHSKTSTSNQTKSSTFSTRVDGSHLHLKDKRSLSQ